MGLCSDTVRGMSSNRAAAWLLLSIAPVLAVGFYHSLKERRGELRPRHAYVWHARYAKLRPHLEGVPRVRIVYARDDPRRGNKRLFQAHYVLAPTVVRLWGKKPVPVKPRSEPLLFDFHNKKSLDQVLRRMARQARRRGVVMDTVRAGKALALVRLYKE